jgi:mRNA interferase MazF
LTIVPVSRGDIFYVVEARTEGGEITKTRPWVIISNDVANLHGGTVICVAITSSTKHRDHPINVLVTASETGMKADGLILCNQIRTVDKGRLLERIGKVPLNKMELVDYALLKSLDIDYTYDAVPPKG